MVIYLVSAAAPPVSGKSPSGKARVPKIPPRREYPHRLKIDREYDRFEKKTVTRIEPHLLGNRLELAAFFSTPDSDWVVPASVTLIVWSEGKSWEYLKCHTFHLLGDNNPIDVVAVTHDGEVVEQGVTENIVVILETANFLRWVNSEKAEFRLCRTEYLMKPEEHVALIDFASRMLPPDPK
ncbi:MAG TPA: hypothetical protein VF720_06565 [Candidatus Eisenbacteria bacterium]